MNDQETTPSRGVLLKGIIFCLLLFLAVMLFYGLLVKPLKLPPTVYYYISRFLFWICLGILFIYVAKVERQPFLVWPTPKQPFGFYVLSFIAIMCILFFGSIIITLILKLSGANTRSPVMEHIIAIFRQYRLLMVFTCVTAGIVEELVFRGYLQTRLQALVKKPYLAIIISALLFGGFHFGYGTIGNVIVPFFIGAVFATYYYLYRNIWVLMFCHFLWDLLLLLVATSNYKH
ncbi:MAG TPA: type II CAAX endopeptidase family protein [Chitinophagaceae bacterium]|nr:type II CAAX endopeptidase family protein [Chitinophagaceae bacterium]